MILGTGHSGSVQNKVSGPRNMHRIIQLTEIPTKTISPTFWPAFIAAVSGVGPHSRWTESDFRESWIRLVGGRMETSNS